MLFGGRNTHYSWETITTRLQTEFECGPRTALAIYTAVMSLTAGKSINESIASSSMLSTREEDYDSNTVREKIAELVGQYESTMWAQPVRTIASRDHSRPAATDGGNQKKRRRRKKKNSKAHVNVVVL